MPLTAFSYPQPQTRFLQAGPRVFKFKLRSGSTCRRCEINDEQVSQEIEDAIRVVLANLDRLQPFATEHFIVFPYKSKWKRVSQLQFQKGAMKLTAYPFLLTLYLEPREASYLHTPAKRCRVQTPGTATEPDLVPVLSPGCDTKRSRREQPLGDATAQHSLPEGLEMDGGPHRWPDQPEAMAGDKGLPEYLVPTHLSSAVEGEEARQAPGEQEESAAAAQEQQPQTPNASTSSGGHTNALIRWASKIFPFSLFSGHKKK